MGNLTFIVPIENKEKFNRKDVNKLFVEQFPKLTFVNSDEWNSIQVRKGDRLVMDIYFGEENDILDIDRDIKYLEENRDKNDENMVHYWQVQIDDLKRLKKVGVPDECIQTTYGTGKFINEKQDIDFFLKDYYKGYIFDEGIHPEFMGPSYTRKQSPMSKKISRFKKFFLFFKN